MPDFGTGWIDTHCHLADPRLEDVTEVLAQARREQITGFVMAGVDPLDWERQLRLSVQHPECLPVFGLHPYFVADHSLEVCEQALDQLARYLPKSLGLMGEVGLDFRTQIVKDSHARQIEMFEAQLELAEFHHAAVVFHSVRAFDETERIFDVFGAPKAGGFVHAFNGSARQAEVLMQYGLHLSVGGAVVRADNEKLHQAICAIPLDRLLVESDSPDQAPQGWSMAQNQPSSILWVADKIAQLKDVTRDEVLASSKRNLLGLLKPRT